MMTTYIVGLLMSMLPLWFACTQVSMKSDIKKPVINRLVALVVFMLNLIPIFNIIIGIIEMLFISMMLLEKDIQCRDTRFTRFWVNNE